MCSVDRDDVRKSLAGLAEQYQAMIEMPSGNHGRAGKGSPRALPLADHLARTRSLILSTLAPWVRRHRAHSRDRLDLLFRAVQGEAEAGDSVSALVVYLRAAEDWLMGADEQRAVDYVHAVQRLAAAVDDARAPRGRAGVPIGRHGEGDCDGLVWAIGVNDVGECTGCDVVRSVAAWRELWPEAEDDGLTDTEAVAWLAITFGVAITPRNLRDWRHRGLVIMAAERRMGLVATTRGSLRAYASERWTANLAV